VDLQKMFDTIGEASRLTRSNYHLTLGGLPALLEDAPPDANVVFDFGGSPTQPHSYRRYYSDLAFEPTDGDVTVSRLREGLSNCLGRTFEGWKGGDYTMKEDTPLWAAHEGCTGRAMVSGGMRGNVFVIGTKQLE